MKFLKCLSFYKLSSGTLVSAISVLVKKIFTKNHSDVHYFLTSFSLGKVQLVIFETLLWVMELNILVSMKKEAPGIM